VRATKASFIGGNFDKTADHTGDVLKW
jgi:hypothetical protein